MATDKRAGIDENKNYKRELVKRFFMVAVVVLGIGALIWWGASERADFDARLEALIEDEKKLRAQVEDLVERINRLSHDTGRSAERARPPR